MDRRSMIVFMVIVVAPVMIAAQSTCSPDDLTPEGTWVSGSEFDESFPQFSSRNLFRLPNGSLPWQKTAYHFQPRKNWMSDPRGVAPLFHMGWYHLFYPYKPDSAEWGKITWGHAVSTDLIHWKNIPLAMFDKDVVVYTSSATDLPDGPILMLYTRKIRKGDDAKQVQNLAYPANLSDPALRDWVKYKDNPVIKPPLQIDQDYFSDLTAWLGPDGTWRVAIWAKYVNDRDTCVFLVYQTTNFHSYFLKGVLYEVPKKGMWECLDIYPISMTGSSGLDNSATGPGIKHVLKASSAGDKIYTAHAYDYYAIGTYDWESDKWTPDFPDEHLGSGLKVDYGRYYASKTFYDPIKMRRINLGYVVEADSKDDQISMGWAGIQTIPRVVVFDKKTRSHILQWPVEEVESLRLSSTLFDGVKLGPDSIVPLDIGTAADQLDISAEFEIDKEAMVEIMDVDATYNCSGGAIKRGSFGPFGLLVNADETLSDLTPIYFYIAKDTNGHLTTFFCADESRSSKASSVDKQVYGAEVPVLSDENLSMRLLVDHTVVESFAQGGRTVITVRIYPTEALYQDTRLFLFNNATKASVVASLEIWTMKSLSFEDYKD